MKQTLLNSLLVAAGLLTGTIGAWGEDTQTKVEICKKIDFESGQASDYWKCGNGTLLTPNYDGSTGQCATIKNSVDRGDYFLTGGDYTGVTNYTIEFDFLMAKGSRTADFAIMSQSAWDSWTTNWGYMYDSNKRLGHNPYLLYFTIPANGTTATFNEDTTKTYTFTEKTWYHFKIDVDATNSKVSYTATKYEESDAAFSGTYTIPEGESTQCKGFYERNNRYNYSPGSICIDNVYIYTMVSGVVAQEPTIELSGVNGKERTYTISFAEGETLYYQLPGETEYTSVSDVTSTTVKTSTSGTLSAYTEKGSAKSSTVTTEVDASEITLNAPTYVLSNLSEGYSKEYTVSVDNSKLLLAPTATLSYVFTPKDGDAGSSVALANGGTISATQAGTYVITATANGYTSSTLTIENDVAYTLVNEYDFSAMTADDFSNTDMWEQSTEGSDKWKWENSTVTKFELKDPATNAATAIDGLILFTNKVPTIYIGYGLMASYANGNYGKVTLADPVAGQYAVYTYLYYYGGATKISVAKAEDGYSLYRSSDILKDIKVYSPSDEVSEPAITDAGYATFAPATNVKVPSNVTVYTVALDEGKSTITLNQIPTGSVIGAGTGVLVAGGAGDYRFISTSAAASTLPENDLKVADGVTKVNGKQYGLADVNGKVGFFKITSDTTMPKGKAYLEVNEEAAAKMTFFSLDGEVTGISTVEAAKADNGAFYTLQGVKTAKPSKGLYIYKGKKVIVK